MAVSLFPMFNILIGTLGVLLFILTTTGSMAFGPQKTEDFSHVLVQNKDNPKVPMLLDWDGRRLRNIQANCEAYFEKDFASSAFDTYPEMFQYMNAVLDGSALGDSIAFVQEHKTQRYFLVFVRPSGMSNFIGVKEFLRTGNTGIGYEPIEQYTRIKL